MTDINEIKQRDRWACRYCGKKFEVDVHQFANPDVTDNYITLCSSCWRKIMSTLPEEERSLCRKLLRKNKVIFIGDCHGKFEALDNVLTSEEPFDFFLSVGDVGTLDDVTPQNITIIDRWKEKGFFVRGNHDRVKFFNDITLHQEINGLQIAGLNGVIKSKRFASITKFVSFNEILYLSHLKNIDILVTHQPPIGIINGKGEQILRELLNYLVPKIHIFGHTHEFKLKYILQTFCISLPIIDKGYAVAYFQGNDLRNLEIIFKKDKKFIRV